MDFPTTKKPWGSFTTYKMNEVCTVKLLNINKGEELSLQHHGRREEFWKVIKGNPKIEIGEEVVEALEGDEFKIGNGVNHRISALSDDVVVLEISTGDFNEEDIVRIEDKYNRA